MAVKLPPTGHPTRTKTNRYDNDTARWNAVTRRDTEADGAFFYAVKTTGVYCRPACAARLPRRENVEFFPSTESARASGYRACKRCRPDELSRRATHIATIERICREFECLNDFPKLGTLAASAGLSTFHFHRLFKTVTGVTPRAYFAACRTRKMQRELRRADSVTEAIYEAGFNSSGRFYAATDESLGMTPTSFRRGGDGAAIQFGVGECSLGSILVAATDRGLCSILLGDDPAALVRDLEDRFPKAELHAGDANFEAWMATVIGFVEAPDAALQLPLDIRGTAFQRKVWEALRQIPFGSTLSYRDVAERIGVPKSYRAVAQACGANPLAIAIPCHRVLRNDGALSGYRWGIERKQQLLAREGARA